MNIRKISAFMVVIMLASSMCGCKKKVESTGRLLTPQGFATEAEADVDNEENTGEQPLTAADRLLFTYEYRNNAWGYQYTVYAIYGDGRCYYYSLDAGDFTPPEFSKDDVDSVIDLSSDMVSFHYDQDFINELYKYATEFDPEAPKTEKHSAYDAGQTSLYYWDEDMNKVMLLNEGDTRYEFDDPNFEMIQKLWGSRYAHM
ncbi:MAG: hypothetical protein J6Y58_09085 [Clostridiales bacterium]|nr:hypothetical protein [Clostridiales bacterium]